MDLSIQARVARGAAWLDETQPDWRDRVDIEAFDMENTTLCVLGQTFRNALGVKLSDPLTWDTTAWRLGEDALHDWVAGQKEFLAELEADEDAQELGFHTLFGFERTDGREDYEDMAVVWLFHIARVV